MCYKICPARLQLSDAPCLYTKWCHLLSMMLAMTSTTMSLSHAVLLDAMIHCQNPILVKLMSNEQVIIGISYQTPLQPSTLRLDISIHPNLLNLPSIILTHLASTETTSKKDLKARMAVEVSMVVVVITILIIEIYRLGAALELGAIKKLVSS